MFFDLSSDLVALQEEIDSFQPQKLWSPVLNVEVSGCQLQFEWEHSETQALGQGAGGSVLSQEPGYNRFSQRMLSRHQMPEETVATWV